jgi:PilS N terminal
MNRKIKNNQEGFFSIEAMGSGFYWLVGMILAFSAVGVLYALSSSNQEIQNTNQLLQVTRHLKSSQGYKKNNLILDLIKLEVIPVNITIDSKNNKLFNTHGGEILIVGNGSGYTLTTKKIPQSDCIKLSTNISRGSLIYQTKINSSTTNGEVDSATAATQCIVGDNTIDFFTRS